MMISQTSNQKKYRQSPVPKKKAIYGKINFWVVCKAMNVVNSFFAQRARNEGYEPLNGYNPDHYTVQDWETFEEMMLDVDSEYEAMQNREARIKRLKAAPIEVAKRFNASTQDEGFFKDFFCLCLVAAYGIWWLFEHTGRQM